MSSNQTNYVPVMRATEAVDQDPEQRDAATPNPLLLLHSLLRGRYLLAVTLALFGAVGGAAVGYVASKPKYQSVGTIRINPTIPSGLPSGQDRLMPAFEAFVKTQQAFLLGERVVTKAMESEEWQAIRPGLAPAAIAKFRSQLDVTYDRGELISVSFTDTDPTVAMKAVKCLTTAYMALYGEPESSDNNQRLTVLQQLQAAKGRALIEQNRLIGEIAGTDIDPDSLEKQYTQCLQENTTRESDWNEARRMLAAAETSDIAPTQDGGAQKPATQSVLSPAEIARTDNGMKQLLAEKRAAERALAVARNRYRPAHVSVIEAEQRLEMASKDVEDYADGYRQEVASKQGGEAVPRSQAELILQGLRTKERNLHRLYDESAAKTKALGQKVVSIQALKRDADKIKQELDETTNGIRQLELQSSFGGRISAVNYGEQPLEPVENKRNKLAMGGAFGGGAAGVAVVLALGFLNRRLVSVHDARLGIHRVDRMLGVLPQVPDDLADAEQAAVAAHCVHHIRTLLQLEPGLPSRRVYAVTSPSPGDGKTTLTIALGMSFATSGAKTLLLDCDMMGGGLSSKMDQMIRPKIGRVLCREGLLTEEQLQTALAAASQTGRQLGDVLVEKGFVSPADVEHAAAVQAQSYVGLADVLAGEKLADCVTGTGRPGLFILPLGSAGPQHAGQLSPAALRAMLAEARAMFDVVLVDTGPILGSLEAAMAAAQSDAVVLAVSRGVPHALVKRSLNRLEEVGAYVLGMVLNRAAAREVADFAFSSGSVRSNSLRHLPPPEANGSVRTDIRLGKVGDAMAASAKPSPR